MKKLILSFILLFSLFAALSFTENIIEAAEPSESDTFSFSYTINKNGTTTTSTPETVNYGEQVSIDAGTLPQSGYEFVGFLENDKVNPSLNTSMSFSVYNDMDIELFYKPENSVAVIFMDANQDYIKVMYTDQTGETPTNYIDTSSDTIPDYNTYSKPGLSPNGWNVGGTVYTDLSSIAFTEDSVVYVSYADSSTSHSLSVINGSGTGTFDFNETVTVTTENGDGNFKYWLKDGFISSTDTSYSFTMAGDHILEAVYTSTSVQVPSGNIITVSPPLSIETGFTTLLGQFQIADGEEMVEYGVIHSDDSGTITLDTVGVTKQRSNKYNPNTNEFVLSFEDATNPLSDNYRAYVITKDSSDVITVSYSQVHTKVWFYNSDGWSTVNAYAFDASDNRVLGDWSGNQAIQDGSTDWWYTYVPTDLSSTSFNLIFIDGIVTYQTKEITFNSLTNVYATASGETFGDKASAESSLETTRIWFYNEQNWETVYYHMWYSSGFEDPDIPVTDYNDPPTATQDGTSQWYYIDIDVNTSITELGVIFKNAQVGDGWKTDDIFINTQTHVYVVANDVSGGNLDTYLTYNQPV